MRNLITGKSWSVLRFFSLMRTFFRYFRQERVSFSFRRLDASVHILHLSVDLSNPISARQHFLINASR